MCKTTKMHSHCNCAWIGWEKFETYWRFRKHWIYWPEWQISQILQNYWSHWSLPILGMAFLCINCSWPSIQAHDGGLQWRSQSYIYTQMYRQRTYILCKNQISTSCSVAYAIQHYRGGFYLQITNIVQQIIPDKIKNYWWIPEYVDVCKRKIVWIRVCEFLGCDQHRQSCYIPEALIYIWWRGRHFCCCSEALRWFATIPHTSIRKQSNSPLGWYHAWSSERMVK